jgi:hypothetical protein
MHSNRLIGALALVMAMEPTSAAQTTRCASVKIVEQNGVSVGPNAVSADGRFVAFMSAATNLVPLDTNGHFDVFVRDMETGAIERVSVASNGTQANGDSDIPSISADGRYVAYESFATNLVPGYTNTFVNVYVRDRQMGTTEIVSVDPMGNQANSSSGSPSISSDGRFVAFWSNASNLVAVDTNGQRDVFVHDRQTGVTEMVSVATGGAQANDNSDYPSISGDGRYVSFETAATNLVAGDVNGFKDVFVRDRVLATTEIASIATGGTQGDNWSGGSSISADGRYVAFFSYATTLVVGDTNGVGDVFVRDRQSGTTERVSVDSNGAQGNGISGLNQGAIYSLAISGNGRYVAFYSESSDLVPNDTNSSDVFVRDLQAGTTERVSVASGGTQANSFADGSDSISADGRYVVFHDSATNLVPNDTNGLSDLFRHDRNTNTTQRVSASIAISNSYSEQASASPDGRYVTFYSNASNLVAGDTNGFVDAFLYDAGSDSIERVSVATGGAQANGPSFSSSVSSDGRYVAFQSEATNLVAGDTNGNDADIFVRDRQTGTTSLVSLSSSGVHADDVSRAPVISADGRFVAFWSNATTLVPGDTNGRPDIFLRDRLNGTTEIVSVATGGAQENGNALYPPAISADGRYVAFVSLASNLVAGDTNGAADVFVRDRQTGTTERVSVGSGNLQGNADCYAPCAISADGRYVVFASDATNLAFSDTNNSTDVFLHDRQTGNTERVDVSSSGAQANFGGYSPSISSDGRFVAFESGATNLVANDTNGFNDVFLRDRWNGTTELVSFGPNFVQGNASSDGPCAVSSDGRYVVFQSDAWTMIVEIDTNFATDIFVHDRGASWDYPSFCYGDGTGAACPCANSGFSAHGCDNSAATGGALLKASGRASLTGDTIELTSQGEKPTAVSVLLQGTSTVSPTDYGDGLRCVGGTLKRLFTHAAVGGVVVVPQGSDPSVSAQSAVKGDVISAGSTRYYQVYYRDPVLSFCASPAGDTFNISNAVAVGWSP